MTEPIEAAEPIEPAHAADAIERSDATAPTHEVDGGTDDGPEPTVTVYWRPGCGFCSMLFHGLRKAGVPVLEVDIWDEPDGAAFVRQHARGNETVPTVDIAGTVLVNPSAARVVAEAVAAGIPLGDPPPRWWQRGRADDGEA